MSKKKVLLRGVFINRDTNGEGVLKVGTTLIRVSTVMGILYLAITGLLNGISYLISGISARGIGGVNYGRVIFPLLVGAIAVYFLKKEKKK